ncbi:MAG TPA: zinc ABC transporter substrate-binding protein [Rhizomicrobium sp.]|nr:zinc ABC transporter substrate-binding protein [Rhizomicrobium sp.]
MKATDLAVAAFLAVVAGVQANPAGPIPIVAAENFYGDIAAQIGGPYVRVTSVLVNPDQDPHLFEASPSVGRVVSAARIVIYNGIDYDPWMSSLLGAARSRNRRSIVVADLMGRKIGDNPHVWYDPATMLVLAKTLAGVLSAEDPAHRSDYARRLAQFEDSLKPLQAEIASLRRRYAETPVTATEPIFGYMFDALGMKVRNQSFQLSVMNNTEPAPSDIAGFENDLRTHRVRLMVFNSQASDPVADRMEKLARASRVPIVGATETEPHGKNYQQWMSGELDAVDNALSGEAR